MSADAYEWRTCAGSCIRTLADLGSRVRRIPAASGQGFEMRIICLSERMSQERAFVVKRCFRCLTLRCAWQFGHVAHYKAPKHSDTHPTFPYRVCVCVCAKCVCVYTYQCLFTSVISYLAYSTRWEYNAAAKRTYCRPATVWNNMEQRWNIISTTCCFW